MRGITHSASAGCFRDWVVDARKERDMCSFYAALVRLLPLEWVEPARFPEMISDVIGSVIA